jgi:hypothetical protein
MKHNIDLVIDRDVELNALGTQAGRALCRFQRKIHISMQAGNLENEAKKFKKNTEDLNRKTCRNYLKVTIIAYYGNWEMVGIYVHAVLHRRPSTYH